MLATIALAVTSATLFGGADFMAGLASRRTPAVVVSALTYAAGLLVVGAVALAAPPIVLAGGDLWWSLLSSATGVLGVVTLYAAFGTGRLSIVAPLTAGLAAAGPAAFDLARGSRLGVTALAGLALAIVAVVVVSLGHSEEERGDMPTRAIVMAVVSGSAFAVSIVALSLVSKGAGLAPLLMQRSLGIAVMTPVALVLLFGPWARAERRPSRSTVGIALAAGIVDATATMSLLAAIRSGPLAVAAVIGGLYPVSTILLAYLVLHERLHGKERIGVALALAAVVLVGLPA
jgi:drug/metabolite transporter (DMT)-like permease